MERIIKKLQHKGSAQSDNRAQQKREHHDQRLSWLNGILRHLCFVVDDLDAALRRLETGGWTRFSEKGGKRIYEVEGGRLLKVIAPEGTVIELREGEGI